MKSISFRRRDAIETTYGISSGVGDHIVLTGVTGLSDLEPALSVEDYAVIHGGVITGSRLPVRHFEATFVFLNDPVSARHEIRSFFVPLQTVTMIVEEDDATYEIDVQPSKITMEPFSAIGTAVIELVAVNPLFERTTYSSIAHTAGVANEFEFEFEDPTDATPSLIFGSFTQSSGVLLVNDGQIKTYPRLVVDTITAITSIEIACADASWSMSFSGDTAEAGAANRTITINFKPWSFSASSVTSEGVEFENFEVWVPPMSNALAAEVGETEYTVTIDGNAEYSLELIPEFWGV